jgi:hypothetical protein
VGFFYGGLGLAWDFLGLAGGAIVGWLVSCKGVKFAGAVR